MNILAFHVRKSGETETYLNGEVVDDIKVRVTYEGEPERAQTIDVTCAGDLTDQQKEDMLYGASRRHLREGAQ